MFSGQELEGRSGGLQGAAPASGSSSSSSPGGEGGSSTQVPPPPLLLHPIGKVTPGGVLLSSGSRGIMETTARAVAAVAAADMTGYVAVEAVRGRSTVTRCFNKYPLKFIVPTKAGSSRTDSVWIYALTYGGGIVSGDCVRCGMSIGDGCTAVFTTQASTKVYKSAESKSSEQVLE